MCRVKRFNRFVSAITRPYSGEQQVRIIRSHELDPSYSGTQLQSIIRIPQMVQKRVEQPTTHASRKPPGRVRGNDSAHYHVPGNCRAKESTDGQQSVQCLQTPPCT